MQFTLRAVLIAVLVISIVCVATIAIVRIVRGPYPQGPIVDRTRWPPALQDLVEDADHLKSPIKNLQVYRIRSYAEHLWCMDGSSELIALIIDRWQLIPGGTNEMGVFNESVPLVLFPKNENTSIKIYASRSLAEKGDSFIVLYDSDNRKIYTYNYFNF